MARGRSAAPSQRQLRVGEEIRHVLAEILVRGSIRDPDLRDVTVTVTEVRVSPDIRNATVYVVPLGGAESARVTAALNRAAAFLRRELADAVTLRYVPALTFVADDSFDAAERIDSVFRTPKVARDLAGQRSPDDPEDDGASS